MKKTVSILAIMLMPAVAGAFECTVCHSKNPKMVAMHRALGYKDCFTCHRFEGKKTPEERRGQMTTDDRCVRCHGAGKAPN